jgi:hypothetical protein
MCDLARIVRKFAMIPIQSYCFKIQAEITEQNSSPQ